ncbi:hypothetical protein [Lentzea nigeriaca]|uniref:hypothetical protein n=1 Tax=Lentzea nigeriaca TaxID=1128665 RepID=UPI0019576923|nr:hypothetical protein [Lentzea nigeriaca]MBM7858263.1 hypothetical protein [Lentzea nigeriaca]
MKVRALDEDATLIEEITIQRGWKNFRSDGNLSASGGNQGPKTIELWELPQ